MMGAFTGVIVVEKDQSLLCFMGESLVNAPTFCGGLGNTNYCDWTSCLLFIRAMRLVKRETLEVLMSESE